MLMSVLRTLINNPFKKSFDTIFMENEKNCQNINFFLIKTFFKWIINDYPKSIH